MALPSELQQMMDDALAAIRADPKQEIGSTRRKAIYNWMRTNEPGKRARKWLEIITAEKVLPIYEAKLPQSLSYVWSQPENKDDIYEVECSVPIKRLPRRMTEVARGVIEKTFSREIAEELANDYYETCSNIFDFAEEDGIYYPSCVVDVLLAASSSVLIAVGYSEREIWSLPEDRLMVNDATIYARSAWASDDHDRLIPEKIVEFWTWWLTEAIPQAWEKAAS